MPTVKVDGTQLKYVEQGQGDPDSFQSHYVYSAFAAVVNWLMAI